MVTYSPPPSPPWLDDLLTEVDREFAVTGVDTPGWPDPHPDREPLEEEYSRCLDPGKYLILPARVEAWARVVTARGLATVDEPDLSVWRGSRRLPDQTGPVRRFTPTQPDGATLLAATAVVDGEPFGIDLGIACAGTTVAFLDALPDCGCDACDWGSADLLRELDDWFLTVARGGVLHARSDGASITQTRDGWAGSGDSHRLEWWLDESIPAPLGVERWIGSPWL
ncbi:DUF6226 family protein [Nocardioides sp. SYSU DS0663]|uniref:DUF6226 family protein n=1 Tax=Nocardioides sp. SYSU DS0663 TaxID=3416445 RepID=UPI003F4C34A1